jgi:hypothetical protein
MVSPKDEFVKFLFNLFDILNIKPMLGMLLFGLLIGLLTVKDIKRWKDVSKFQKNMDIAIWTGLGMLIIVIIVSLIRGEF